MLDLLRSKHRELLPPDRQIYHFYGFAYMYSYSMEYATKIEMIILSDCLDLNIISL